MVKEFLNTWKLIVQKSLNMFEDFDWFVYFAFLWLQEMPTVFLNKVKFW